MSVRKLNITNYINNNFREYAIYTLINRGIPGFYDSLTNVQRLILLNTPTKFVKSLTVVGDAIKAGYHHGNQSLEKSISRLARPFDCAERLLIGDGFFGTQVEPNAASARYTSVMINEKIDKIIKEFSFLNTKSVEGGLNPLNINFPIGLLLCSMGIAVGHRTMILPRNFKHIQEYLEGKRKTLTPYFEGFTGKIEKYNNLENAWLLEGDVDVYDKQFLINIKSLPPLIKYDSFIKKLGLILGDLDFKLINNSKTTIDISIKLNTIDADAWQSVKEKILKATKIIFKESVVLIKDKQVLEYDCVEDYLEDFKVKNLFLKRDSITYYINLYQEEIEFLEAKLKFFIWILDQKKKNHYSEDEVSKFLGQFNPQIYQRLDNIKLRKLNEDEIRKTEISIVEYRQKVKMSKEELNQFEKFLKTISVQLHTKNRTVVNLFEEEKDEIDDIEIFTPTKEQLNDIED